MRKRNESSLPFIASAQMKISGQAVVRVLNKDGSVAHESKPTKNLILYGGLEGFINHTASFRNYFSFLSLFAVARAGSDSTPNFTAPDGTFARAGNTVSRATGTAEFSGTDVGSTIKFSGGEEAYITAINSPTQVEVRESGIIPASNVVIWKTNQTDLVSPVSNSVGTDASSTHEDDLLTGTTTFVRVHNFPEETTAKTYNEIGLSRSSNGDLTTRLVLENPVNVGIGQSLQTTYTINLTLGGFVNEEPINVEVTGWPRPYEISSIIHDGAGFDVTFPEDHHYEAGDSITITNAVPERVNVGTITSTPAEFTVTTTEPHNLAAGDSIELQGSSNNGYDGSWTILSIDSATVFKVSSVADLSDSILGTVRRSTPDPFFNGNWTIESSPTTSSIRILDATMPVGLEAGSGDLFGELTATGRWAGNQIFDNNFGGNTNGILSNSSSNGRTIVVFDNKPEMVGLGESSPFGFAAGSGGNVFIKDTDNHEFGNTTKFNVDEANIPNIGGFMIQGSGQDSLSFMVRFNQFQRKDAGYTLTLGWKISLRPDLSQ